MRRYARMLTLGLVFGIGLVTPILVAQVSIPHTFVAGETAVADEVNANFVALADAVAALSSRVDTLDGEVSTLGDAVDGLGGDLEALANAPVDADTFAGQPLEAFARFETVRRQATCGFARFFPRFSTNDSEWTHVTSSGTTFRAPSRGTIDYTCDVELPIGARIVALTAVVFDSTAILTVDCGLRRIELEGDDKGTRRLLANTPLTSGSPGLATLSTSDITDPDVTVPSIHDVECRLDTNNYQGIVGAWVDYEIVHVATEAP